MRSEDAAGFTVLVSDEGSPAEVLGRARLANAVATRMTEAGFPPYDGRDYGERYEHGEVSGTFLDRRGLLMLRRPAMPSVIVETYHAYDLEEVRRWDEPATVDAFARALAQAILDTQRSPPEDAP